MRREEGVRQMDRRGAVLLAGRKGDDLALAGQRRLAAAKVGNQPVDRLVRLSGCFSSSFRMMVDSIPGTSGRIASGASGAEAIW